MKRGTQTLRVASRYKQLTLGLLNVYQEVVRCGSQAAAARKLEMAQPTVWEQMQALERLLGTKLLEIQGRNSLPTSDGLRLLELSLPVIEGFASIPIKLAEERGAVRRQLRIAATPRTLHEDLPDCVIEFEKRYPDVLLTISEYDDSEVVKKVLDHEIDVGFTPIEQNSVTMRYLESELAFETDIFVVTQPDHPLAKQKTILPEDIIGYPIVNGPGTVYGPRMKTVEAQIQSSASEQRQVSAFYTSTIRKFVKLGFGIGIVNRRRDYPSDPELHERSLSKHAGRSAIHAIRPRGINDDLSKKFIKVVQKLLTR